VVLRKNGMAADGVMGPSNLVSALQPLVLHSWFGCPLAVYLSATEKDALTALIQANGK